MNSESEGTESPRLRFGVRARLHLRVSTKDGHEFESTYGDEPLEFTVGDGTLAEGLEAALTGLAAGEHRSVTLTAESAFGAWDPDKVHRLPRGEFPQDADLAPGEVWAFSTPAGEELPGRVVELQSEAAIVDFNHPLAGHSVHLEADVLEVWPTGGALQGAREQI
jgi:FKBP-type peptidyl-prolyl cis-trans isomerase SlpA